MKSLKKLGYAIIFISVLFVGGCSVLPELPDLVITQVNIGGGIVSFQIMNQGNFAYGTCSVCLFINGSLEDTITVSSLLPGASVDEILVITTFVPEKKI